MTLSEDQYGRRPPGEHSLQYQTHICIIGISCQKPPFSLNGLKDLPDVCRNAAIREAEAPLVD